MDITNNALKQILDLRNDSGLIDHCLRISVVGGGCSGLSYKLDFQKAPIEKDKVYEYAIEGRVVKVLVDSKSALFLSGLVLDFQGGLNGKGFIFNNPKAARSCGCGTSFSV